MPNLYFEQMHEELARDLATAQKAKETIEQLMGLNSFFYEQHGRYPRTMIGSMTALSMMEEYLREDVELLILILEAYLTGDNEVIQKAFGTVRERKKDRPGGY